MEVYNERRVEDFTHEMFENIEDKSRYDLTVALNRELTHVMNEVHNLNCSERFWNMILRFHVKAVITRKDILASEKFNKNPDLYPINSFTIPSRKKKLKNGLILFVKHIKTFGALSDIESVLRKNNVLNMGFPKIHNFDKEGLGTELADYYPAFWGIGDRSKRRKLNRIADNINNPFFKNVVKQIPRILVEHFENLYSKIDLNDPEKKVFHVHFCESFLNQLLIAKYVENGAKLIWYQHGYQTAPEIEGNKADEGHELQLKYLDEYRTWGWSRNRKEIPWKAYRLEEFRIKYEKFENSKEYDLLLCYPNISKFNRKSMAAISNKIANNLDDDKYKKILARPRRSNKIQSHVSQLDFIDAESVSISTGLKPMMEEMSKCRLVLQMNIPSTNFLECLYVDKPTIGVLKNESPTQLIEPYYRFFLKNGVYHMNFDSLIEHLNSIDIEDWWNTLIQKREYNEYKELFLRKV